MSSLTIQRARNAHASPLSIGSILRSGVDKAARQEIVYGDRRFTYLDLNERVGRLASALAGLGIVPGKSVGVMDWDTHRYLEAFFAVPMMGAVLCHINPRLSPEQIVYTINHAAAEVLLVNADFLPLIAPAWNHIEPGKRIVVMSDGKAPAAAAPAGLPVVAEYEAMLSKAEPRFAFPALDEDTRATTFYTTGTTGLPKGVYYSHRQLVLHTLAMRCALADAAHGTFSRRDVYMPLTPMFHVHAWGLPYVATMIGAKQVYPGRYAGDIIAELLTREKATVSHCVPTVLQMVLGSSKVDPAALNGWKVVIGGAALPRALARKALELGIDIFTGYGMSETCPVLTLAHLSDDMLRLDLDQQAELRCMTGKPIDFVDLRIVDEDMRDVPHDGNTPGEIVVRAPWLTQGYLNDSDNSERLWQGGWLHTGDIAVMRPDGFLRITDRLKDVIKTGGEWVSSLQLEDLILHCPGVAEVAVIGIPDPRWTERPMAVVVARPDDPADSASIRANLTELASKGVISKYAVPERIAIVTALPKTSVGKHDKKKLREEYGSS